MSDTIEVDGLVYGEHMIRALRIERDELQTECDRLTAALDLVRSDLDRAVAAHDPSDPRHRSHGGQHDNGPCCAFGNVTPGAVSHMKRLRTVIDRVRRGGEGEG